MSERVTTERVFVFLALLVAGALYVGEAALPGHMPADFTRMRDTYHLALICSRWGAWLREGHLAWWMPEFSGGHPVHALWLYGLAHPASLLWAALPLETAYTWGALLHGAFGGLGVFVFLRGRDAGRSGAVCGAIVFAFSEYVVGKLTSGGVNQVWSLAWAPWVLVAIERVVAGRRGGAAVLGLTAGLALLAGHVQTWFTLGPALAVHALVATSAVPRERRGTVLLRLSGAAVLAVGIAAVQWLPSLELVLAAGTQPVSDPQLLRAWSAPLPSLAAKLYPGLLRGTATEFAHEHGGVTGALACGLALLGACARERRRVLWAVLALVGLVLALGYGNPLSAWLNGLPVLSWARVPARAQALTVLGAALLAGHGADDWLRGRVAGARLVAVATVLATLLAAAALVVALDAQGDGARAAALRNAAPAAVAATLAGLAIGAGALAFARRRPERTLLAELGVLVGVGLAAPPVLATATPFLHTDWQARLPESARGHRVLQADFRLPYVEASGVRSYRLPAHLEPHAFARLTASAAPALEPWMDIGALLFVGPLPPGPPVGVDDAVRVVPAARPPIAAAWFDTAEEGVADDVALARLLRGERVLLLADGTLRADAPEAPPRSVPAVRPPQTDPCRVTFDVDAPAAGWLFVSEKHYPGWTAEVGGAPAELRRANVAFGAVAVPAGRSQVVLVYAPGSVHLGALVSALAAASAAVALLRARWRPPEAP